MWHLTYAVTCIGVYKRRPSSDVSTKTTKKESLSSYASPSSLDYPEFPTLRSVQFRRLINSNNTLILVHAPTVVFPHARNVLNDVTILLVIFLTSLSGNPHACVRGSIVIPCVSVCVSVTTLAATYLNCFYMYVENKMPLGFMAF